MIKQINLYVQRVPINVLVVEEVDDAQFIDLCCEAHMIQGKKMLPSHVVRYVGARIIPRIEMRQAIAKYLNQLLTEGVDL